MLLLLRVNPPRKLRVFSGMFFFLLKTGWIKRQSGWSDYVDRSNHEKNIRLSSEPVHLGEAVRDGILPQLRILIGHKDPVINQPGFHGSCHVRVLLPLLIWSTQQFFCVFVLGYHLLGSSSHDASGCPWWLNKSPKDRATWDLPNGQTPWLWSPLTSVLGWSSNWWNSKELFLSSKQVWQPRKLGGGGKGFPRMWLFWGIVLPPFLGLDLVYKLYLRSKTSCC